MGKTEITESDTGRLNRKTKAIPETDLMYRPVGLPEDLDEIGKGKRWRLRFDALSSEPAQSFGLDIYTDVVLGRSDKESEKIIDLTPYNAARLGVSREHLRLHVDDGRLFVIDLESTNGTRVNGLKIGRNTPAHLSDHDLLELGNLKLKVTFVDIPATADVNLSQMVTLAEALSHLAKAITSRLKLAEVLAQIVDMSMALTAAGEASIWLVDSRNSEIAREVTRGIEDESAKQMRVPADGKSLVAEVIRTGKVLRKSRQVGEGQIKIKTDYMVEALLFVPLIQGSVTFGVLEVTHHKPGDEFTKKDEDLLTAIGDFAAIAISNARAYETAQQMVIQRTHELDALNELITAASASLKLTDVLNTIVEHMRKQWSEQPIGLWMIDEGSGLLKPHLMPGVNDDPFSKQIVELGKGVLGGVASKGAPLMDNVAGSSQPVANDDTVTPLPRSIACVPLIFQRATVKGLLAVLGQPGQELSQEDLDLLQSYANHVVTAIDNALLYEQSERERATIRALTESLAQPLLIVNHHGELIIANHTADALLEEILGADTDDKIEQKPALSQVLEAISKSTGQATELTIGERIYVVTVQQKSDVGTIILMQDVTEVRQLERLRVEVAQALSHDIRGPLASIIGYAEFIGEPSLPRSEISAISEHILGAAGRMNEMSSHLLDFAMLKESARDKHGPVDFKHAVENAVTDLRGATLAKSVVIDFSVEGKPVLVEGDINRLYRSVLNLIHNALKYSPEKGKILVRLHYQEDAVELTVRDHGPGIPEEELSRIFEKYYRVEKSPRERSGIGLGLAMVRAAVEDHDGTVSARNPKGGGAEFTIKLPRQTGKTS